MPKFFFKCCLHWNFWKLHISFLGFVVVCKNVTAITTLLHPNHFQWVWSDQIDISWEHINVSVQFSSVTQSCPTLCNPWASAHQASLSLINSWSLLKPMSIELVMPSHPLSSPSPPALNLSKHHESALRIRWPKYWSISFSISPSRVNSGLISFRIYWFDLFAIHGALRSLLQHHNFNISHVKVFNYICKPPPIFSS